MSKTSSGAHQDAICAILCYYGTSPGGEQSRRPPSNASGEISQYSANEFARCNRHTALLSWLSAYQCDRSQTITLLPPPTRPHPHHTPQHLTTKPCVVSPREALLSQNLKGSVHLSLLTPKALRQFHRYQTSDEKKVHFGRCKDNFTFFFCVRCYSFLSRRIFNSAAALIFTNHRSSEFSPSASLNHVSSSSFFFLSLLQQTDLPLFESNYLTCHWCTHSWLTNLTPT